MCMWDQQRLCFTHFPAISGNFPGVLEVEKQVGELKCVSKGSQTQTGQCRKLVYHRFVGGLCHNLSRLHVASRQLLGAEPFDLPSD